MKKHLMLSLAAITFASMAATASAATVTFNLTRQSILTNVSDAEGRWQFDGGNVYVGRSLIGHYTRKKRVSFGIPNTINKAAMEMTIIWAVGNLNFTVEGTHSFSTGAETGGVSAVSPGLAAIQNATFTGDSDTLIINY